MLYDAVKSNDVSQVKTLLNKGANINAVYDDGITHMHIVAANNYKVMAEFLLMHGADINIRETKSGMTPLHIAVSKRNKYIISLLRAYDVDCYRRDFNDATPVEYAIQQGYNDIIKMFNSKLPNRTKNNWFSWFISFPKCLATKRLRILFEFILKEKKASEDSITQVNNLIKSGARLNERDEYSLTPLCISSQIGDTNCIKILLETGADVNLAAGSHDGNTPLLEASQEGHTEIVKILLKAGACIEAVNRGYSEGYTSLWIASQEGHTEIVKILLDAGAYINAVSLDGATPLLKACENGHTKIVKLLLEAGADMDIMTNDKDTPFTIAKQGRHNQIAKLLIRRGCKESTDPEFTKQKPDNIAFWEACYDGDLKVARKFIKRGIDVNTINKESMGSTALHAATESKNPALVTLLLDNGANIDATDNDGSTSLYYARNAEVVHILLKRGANPNKDSDYTPLMINVVRQFDFNADNEDIIKLLIAYGADPTIVNQYGETPLLFAQRAMADGSNTTLLPILLKANN